MNKYKFFTENVLVFSCECVSLEEAKAQALESGCIDLYKICKV